MDLSGFIILKESEIRVAEGARLESVYTATYRGFESLSHRQKSVIKSTAYSVKPPPVGHLCRNCAIFSTFYLFFLLFPLLFLQLFPIIIAF